MKTGKREFFLNTEKNQNYFQEAIIIIKINVLE